MICLNHVSKRFGKRVALDDVCLEIVPGEVTLLLGSNGAGKSTLLRSVLGIADFEGGILVNGRDPRGDGPGVRSLVGYMPQNGGLHGDLTVDETIRFFAEIRNVPLARGMALIDEAGLTDHRATKVRDLSGGMRQRLGFVVALLSDPPILILDEPGSSLDAASREWVAEHLRCLARAGRTVLVSTHAGPELMLAGARRVILDGGRVADDQRVSEHCSERLIPAELSSVETRRASVVPIARKELLDSIRNRWVLGYALILAVVGLAAASAGLDGSAGLALQTFGRTTATLMNLCLLLSPIVAVLTGAAAIAGEQDRGTLEMLLAQPIDRTRLLLAKYFGLFASLTIATVAGFAPAGIFIVANSGLSFIGYYLLFPAIAATLGAAMLGIGMLISVSSRTGVQAQGTGVLVWFACVLLYDLLLIGTLSMSGLPVGVIGASLVANPVDAARVLGVLALEPDLYLLGPAGAYLAVRFTRAGAAVWLIGSLVFWMVAPLAVSLWRFRRGSRRATVTPPVHTSANVIIRTEEAPSS
jgi:ABC-type multidrug transport system ATPase subunit/ABC-type transport system involved in multi-copper enzyme maturation permease subunit